MLGTPVRRAPADPGARQLGAVAWAAAPGLPLRVELPGVSAAAADGVADRPPRRPAQLVELVVGERAGAPPGRDPGLPEDLVGEQVAHAGDRALVEQPRLDGCVAPADPGAELLTGHLARVGADVREVGLDERAAEAAPVVQGEAAAIGELQREAVPAAGGRLVD